MVTDATKKYRDVIVFGLLAVAALYFLGALSLLFKSSDLGFATKSVLVTSSFQATIPIVSLVVAVLLATRFGAASAQARIVVLIAMGIAGLDLLFAVITFFAQFGSGAAFSTGFGYSGVAFAGKTTGVIFGLAQLGFLGVASLYIVTEFLRLPAPVQAAPSQWADGGYPATGGAQPPWPPAGQGYQQGGQQSWSQQGQPYGGQPYGDQGASTGWGAGEQGQPTSWAGQSGWEQQAGGQAGWEQPGQGSWEQPGQGGWGQQPGYPTTPPPPAAPPAFEPAPSWGDPEHPEATPGDRDIAAPTGQPDIADEGGSGATGDLSPAGDAEGDTRPDDEAPSSDGWWQHPNR